MKIALVTHSFFPNSVGGRERYVYELADALSKTGNNIEVFTCSDNLFSGYNKKEKLFTIRYFPTIRIHFPTGYYRIPPSMILRLLRTDADIIHAHDIHHFTTFMSALVCKIRKKPFLLTEHGYPEQFGFEKLLIKVYDKFFLPIISMCSNKMIAVSEHIREELIHRYEVPRDKIQVIYNFIDLKKYTLANDSFRKKYSLENKNVILLVGRMVKEKGFNYVVEAMPKILEEVPNTILLIIGPTNYHEKTLRRIVKEHNLENKIVFCGVVSEELLKSAYANSNIIVIPSTYEPFGIVALEAMAYGKPIVASRVGGLSEFLKDGKNSLLVEPGDVSGLESCIVALLKNKKLSRKISIGAKRDVKMFGLNKFMKNMMEVYKPLINKDKFNKKYS